MDHTSPEYSFNQYPPKTWLVESILATLCCCMPLGLVGIVYAAKVETLYNAGSYMEAKKASEEARKWTIIALIAGLISEFSYCAMNFSRFSDML